MARPRVVLPNVPHHVTQRGNRRQPVFFGEDDYVEYMDLIATFAEKTGAEILAYCLMPNHVHFVLVPNDAGGLRATLGEAHRRYTRYVNFREGWRGHLWQERFHSFPMDEAHLLMAMPLYRAQSGPRRTGGCTGCMAVVECGGAFARPRRSAG